MFLNWRYLFMFPLVLGALMAASSMSWATAWFGLELNLLSFIPLISRPLNIYSNESALKYFLVQALGSALVIATSPLVSFWSWWSLSSISLILSLSIKLGSAPFHFWFPSVMQGISWECVLILMTVQKIGPLFLMNQMFLLNEFTCNLLKSFSMLSAIIGGVGGLNQTLLRKIMAYSSINHMGWMMAAIYHSKNMLIFYFLTYCLIASSIVIMFMTHQMNHFNQIYLLAKYNSYLKILVFCMLLSLGGLPPFYGFLPKMMLTLFMAEMCELLWLSIMMVSTMMSLYYYIKIFTAGSTMMSFTSNPILMNHWHNMFYILILLNFLPLFNPTLFMFPL
uniref:NADH-ubiquinone oxidoreductase chain 2 n=1 Tax=Thor amboinensis TaxID=652917 RepID=A0A7G7MWM9_9EUCA|nr:NADH dehydrogenase subunit 2 [Thor amboinensis]QNG57238.1 NADH dehydrogenase subunit 2 [Thor amboinensis]